MTYLVLAVLASMLSALNFAFLATPQLQGLNIAGGICAFLSAACLVYLWRENS